MAGFPTFTPRTANTAAIWKDINPAASFLGGMKAVRQMDLDDAAEQRLRELADTDRLVKETLLPLQVEQARANILSTHADIGYKGAMANYYATGKAKAATLAQQRAAIANAIEPMPFYKSQADETPQGPSLNLQTPVYTPQDDDGESLLDNFLGSSSDSESSVFDDLADARDLSGLPNNAKLVSSSSGMDPTTYQAMNNASKALEADKKTFDLAATAETFSARPNPQTASEIKNANIEAGVAPPERLKNKSALAAYMQENEPPSLQTLVENFDTKRAQAKTFIDNNHDSLNANAWGTAQSLKQGIGPAYDKFDNDLRMGRYGISAAQVDRVLQKYPANYAAVAQIAPYLQGSGDIDEAMARYEQDKTNRVQSDRDRVARMEKIQDAKITLLGQSGEITDYKKQTLDELDRQLNLLRTPQEKLSEFSSVDSEAQNLARGWAKTVGEENPTVNYLGEPMDAAQDKATYSQKFQELVTSGRIPVATAKITDKGEVELEEAQIPMWFKSKGMQMPENTPVRAGVYINNTLVPFEFSYSKGKNGAEFSANPLIPVSKLPQDKPDPTSDNSIPATKYDTEAAKEIKSNTLAEASKERSQLIKRIEALESKASNVPDFDKNQFWGSLAPVASRVLGKVSGQATTAADKQKAAQDIYTGRGYARGEGINKLKSKLAELEQKFPELKK